MQIISAYLYGIENWTKVSIIDDDGVRAIRSKI